MKMIVWVAALAVVGVWLADSVGGDWLIVLVVVLVLLVPLPAIPRGRAPGGVPKEFDGAPIGVATVTAATRTGRSVNEQPELDLQLRVDTADGRTFPATLRQVVDVTDLVAVQPQAILPVRYLSDGRVALAMDAPTHELQAALDRVHVAKGWLTPKQLRIAEYGIDANAVVVSTTPTGHTADGRSELRMCLRVTRQDGTTFELTQDKKFPPTSVPQVRQGMVVRVKYLPHDESDVAVVTSLLP